MHARCIALTTLAAAAGVISAQTPAPSATPVSNAALAAPTPAGAWTPATRIVTALEPAMTQLVRQAKLGPGQTALVWGNASMLPLMERLAIAVQRAGAVARISVTTDSMERARYNGPPEQFKRWVLGQIAERQAGDVVVFNFPMAESWALYGLITQEQREMAQAGDTLWAPAKKAKPWRDIWLNLPISSDTVGTALTLEQVARLRAAAMMVDYDAIAATGALVRDRLVAAKKIRLTSSEGTDLTFTLRPGQTAVNAGLLTDTFDPGGEVVASIDTTSGSGKIRAPWDACTVPLVNEAIDVVKGKPVRISAGNDEACVQQTVAPLSLGVLKIGLNPASDAATTGARVPVNDFYGAGLVSLGFGGQKWLIPIPHATVLADGVALVRDGRLVTAPTATARARP